MYHTLTTKSLSIILEGTEQVLALRAKITVEKSAILSVEWHDVFSDWETMTIRMPGSYLPYWVMAGSYWTEQGWDFVFARKPKGMMSPILHNVLVVTTVNNKYRRLIIELSKDNAKEIMSWWKAKSKA
jgi:hypothetical protein